MRLARITQAVSPAPVERNYSMWTAQLHPTHAQARALAIHRRQLQKFWNWAIRRYRWHLDNGRFSEYSLDAEIAGRAESGLSMREMSDISLRIYLGWKEFLEYKPTTGGTHPRKPREKTRKDRPTSLDVAPQHVRIVDGCYIRFADIACVRFKGPLPLDASKYRKITLTLTSAGWHVRILCENP